MIRRVGSTVAAAVVLAIAVPASAGAFPEPTGGAARAAFVTHHGHYWSWAGPRNWNASYGAYGITIFGDDDETLDLGFSSILCTPAPSVAASVRRYLKRQRRTVARGRTNILRKSKIRRVGGLGPNYFRQTLDIAARANGKRYLGQVALDYQVSNPTYCYRRSLSLVAPARGFGGSLKTLLKVYGSLAYFGPGLPPDPDNPRAR